MIVCCFYVMFEIIRIKCESVEDYDKDSSKIYNGCQ